MKLEFIDPLSDGFGSVFYRLKKQNGNWSDDVAFAIGVKPNVVRSWNNSRFPSTENLSKLAEHYKVPVEFLKNGPSQGQRKIALAINSLGFSTSRDFCRAFEIADERFESVLIAGKFNHDESTRLFKEWGVNLLLPPCGMMLKGARANGSTLPITEPKIEAVASDHPRVSRSDLLRSLAEAEDEITQLKAELAQLKAQRQQEGSASE